MPYPGNFIYSYGLRWADNNIYRLKLEDNSELSFNNSYRSHTLASNGLICTEYFRPSFQIRPNVYTLPVWRATVFDLAGGSKVYNEQSNTTNLTAVISEDGKFIWANGNRVFRISGTTSELIGVLTGSGSFIGFRPDNSVEIMFRDGYKINFYNANTLTFIRSIESPSSNHYWVYVL